MWLCKYARPLKARLVHAEDEREQTLTHLCTYLPTHTPTHIPAPSNTCIFKYTLTHIITFLPACPNDHTKQTYMHTHMHTHILTCVPQ